MIQDEALKDVLPIKQCYDYVLQDEGRHEAFKSFFEELKTRFPKVDEMAAISLVLLYILDGNERMADRAMIKFSSLGQALTSFIEAISEMYNEETLRKSMPGKKKHKGCSDHEDKQKLEELYHKLSPEVAMKLGIIYTPTPIVDSILHAVATICEKEFGKSISDNDVIIADPTSGMGIFALRMLELGLIKEEDLERKLKSEIFCNDILLYSSFVTKMNLEEHFYKTTGHYIECGGVSCCNALEDPEDTTNSAKGRK